MRVLWLGIITFAATWAHAVEVNRAVVCAGVEQRSPVGASDRFPADVGQIYGHLTLVNKGPPTTVDVVWRHGSERIARVQLNVGPGSRWRTWAKMRVSAGRTGAWSMAVIDPEGRRLAYVPFVVGEGGDASPPVIHRATEAPRAAPRPVARPTPAPVVVPPAPANVPRPAGCRALVNVRVDGGGRSNYHTAEVNLEVDPPRVGQVTGLVVSDNGRLHTLHVARQVAELAGHGGKVVRRWDQLVGVPLNGGEPRVWYAYPATLAPPSRPAADGTAQRFVEENLIEIESVMGPYVGLRASLAGHAGGRRGFDHSRYATVRGGQRVDVPKLMGDLVDVTQMRAAELRGRGLDNQPDASAHDFRRAAFASTADGLKLKTLMRCCSWAENRGLLEVDVLIEPAPRAIAPFAPDADGWHEGPNECGAIGTGTLARVGGGPGRQLRFGDSDRQPYLLGVRWLSRGERLPTQGEVDAARARIPR